MPTLKNSKHELFCQNVAKGMSQEEAYADVYPAAKNPNARRSSASELRTKPIISQRIKELLAEGEKKAIAAVSRRIKTKLEVQEWWSDVIDARAEANPIQLKAAELLGKSEAWFTEKVEHAGKITLEDLVTGSFSDISTPK